MNFAYILYIIVVSSIILYLLWAERPRYFRHSATQEKYTSLLTSVIFYDLALAKSTAEMYRFKNRDTLIQTIHTLISHTYGCDNKPIKEIVIRHNLLQHITRRLHAAPTRRKCELLSQLSSIIHSDAQEIVILKHLIHSKNHNIRIGALITLLAANPSQVISTLSSFDFRLQPLDIVRIITLIRQGRITVALEPLFESGNRNLLLLSMALVRTFGICIVDKQLYDIITHGDDADLIYDAIYTITYLKRPLRHKVIKACVASMSEAQRKQLCRHLSVEGYSVQSINAILSPPEVLYAKQLITSFKRQLSQPQAI